MKGRSWVSEPHLYNLMQSNYLAKLSAFYSSLHVFSFFDTLYKVLIPLYVLALMSQSAMVFFVLVCIIFRGVSDVLPPSCTLKTGINNYF